MRVVHLGKYYPPASGGIETHTQTLARAQAELGADVRVIVVNHATADGTDVTFERFRRTPDARDQDGPVQILRAGRRGQLAKLDLSPQLVRLIREVRRDPPDVWHLHTPNISLMLAVLAEPRVRPLVVTHHSDIVRQRVLKHAVRPLESAVYRRASRLLPTSPDYASGSPLLRKFAEKVEPLPLGLDLRPFLLPSLAAQAHTSKLRVQYPGPIWLSVGRLIYYKALDVALRALQLVPGRLIVIGTGPMQAEWQDLARELGVADRVVWHGRASDDELVGSYHAATAYWFPSNSRAEGFGLVQVEAMASGCPVINTAIPHSGVPWVAKHDVAALTVPVNDPKAFAAAARRLLEEPGLRDRLVNRGREEAISRFDHHAMAAHSLDIYRRVMSA